MVQKAWQAGHWKSDQTSRVTAAFGSPRARSWASAAGTATCGAGATTSAGGPPWSATRATMTRPTTRASPVMLATGERHHGLGWAARALWRSARRSARSASRRVRRSGGGADERRALATSGGPSRGLVRARGRVRGGRLAGGPGLAGGDARRRVVPARLEGHARLVEVDDKGGVIGRDRRALAGLAVDLGPHDPGGHGSADQEMVDAHAVVLVEHPGPVVPPRIPTGFRALQAVRV